MKVLQVNKLFYPKIGGIEKVALDICNQLSSKVDMKVLVANTSFSKSTEVIEGARIVRVPSIGTLFSMPIAPTFPIELNKNLDVDIIHFHFPFPLGELSYLLNRKKTNARTVVTWHSDIVRQKNILKVYEPLLHKFLESVDCIVATSPNLIKHSKFLQKYQDKCVVIPLGINPEQFKQGELQIKRATEIKESYKRPIIFFMGRLVYYKGISYLIEAMKDINADLLIGGTGDLRKDLDQQVKELGIGDRIHFLDFVSENDLSSYYYASDIFVLPSVEESEAFGIVQLEAQACGIPVVSTNLNTGVPFANLHGITGLTVPPKDSKELAASINKLLKDRNLREKLGEQAQNRVLSEFTIQGMGTSYFELYKQLCNKKKYTTKGC